MSYGGNYNEKVLVFYGKFSKYIYITQCSKKSEGNPLIFTLIEIFDLYFYTVISFL